MSPATSCQIKTFEMIDEQQIKTWDPSSPFVSLNCNTGRFETDTNLATLSSTPHSWTLKATGGGRGRKYVGCYQDDGPNVKLF